ncbi:hypothetical protein IKR20_07805 [bacterium]|nr:hypothetical protein [bacterium]
MKKFLAVTVAIILALFVISCGDSKKEEPKTDDDVVDSGNTEPDGDSGSIEEPDGDSGDSGSTACKLDAAYATSDAEAYFAFKGMGEINSRSAERPSFANMVTATLVGVEGKDLDLADSYSFFMPTTFQNQNAIMLQAMGDPNMDSGRFTAAALAVVPIELIDFMKENETDHLDQAPIVQVIDIAISKDEAYGKQCILAANKADESGKIALGKMQICYDKNEEFAVGETFKLSMAAELTVGEALVDFYQDVETVDDLCTCFDMDTDEEVDCASVDWEGGEPTPDGDTEPTPDGDTEPTPDGDEEPTPDEDTTPATDEEPAADEDTTPATDEEPAADEDVTPAADEEPAGDEDVTPEPDGDNE